MAEPGRSAHPSEPADPARRDLEAERGDERGPDTEQEGHVEIHDPEHPPPPPSIEDEFDEDEQ
ncbi:hypothetical protein HUO13_18035 [Saccharopolyspora erythraea]|uniref:hypothetical protein n=1 Tax=Saccharopolyspora erythraea TaxID=1836 RepID=UPI001BA4ACF9|nr:hypothetical protein [Saccharopolyspora erythraea]QUH02450.1 hypothetical protein HUO13_18035 [Saccharopolyspora erythraea]